MASLLIPKSPSSSQKISNQLKKQSQRSADHDMKNYHQSPDVLLIAKPHYNSAEQYYNNLEAVNLEESKKEALLDQVSLSSGSDQLMRQKMANLEYGMEGFKDTSNNHNSESDLAFRVFFRHKCREYSIQELVQAYEEFKISMRRLFDEENESNFLPKVTKFVESAEKQSRINIIIQQSSSQSVEDCIRTFLADIQVFTTDLQTNKNFESFSFSPEKFNRKKNDMKTTLKHELEKTPTGPEEFLKGTQMIQSVNMMASSRFHNESVEIKSTKSDVLSEASSMENRLSTIFEQRSKFEKNSSVFINCESQNFVNDSSLSKVLPNGSQEDNLLHSTARPLQIFNRNLTSLSRLSEESQGMDLYNSNCGQSSQRISNMFNSSTNIENIDPNRKSTCSFRLFEKKEGRNTSRPNNLFQMTESVFVDSIGSRASESERINNQTVNSSDQKYFKEIYQELKHLIRVEVEMQLFLLEKLVKSHAQNPEKIDGIIKGFYKWVKHYEGYTVNGSNVKEAVLEFLLGYKKQKASLLKLIQQSKMT